MKMAAIRARRGSSHAALISGASCSLSRSRRDNTARARAHLTVKGTVLGNQRIEERACGVVMISKKSMCMLRVCR